jgi:DNA-binding response OmpR family regulator
MLDRVNILVIEDDARTAQAARRGLAAEGYNVAVARTGEEGFSQISARLT